MRIKYEYFVSYISSLGYSNCIIRRNNRIKSMKDVAGIGRDISENNNFETGAIVLNYHFIRFGLDWSED